MASSANYDSSVQQLYVTYFGRPADPSGLTNFAAALALAAAPTDLVGLNSAYNTNADVKNLIDSFGTSVESIKLYGDTSSQSGVQAFVNDVFQNLFGRAANADGLAFWSNAILSGGVTQGDAALSIAAGAALNSTAQGKLDAEAVANKVAVASQFTSDLVMPQQISAYSGAAAAAAARSLLSTVSATTDPSTYGSAIGSTIYNIANPTASQSFYLTTGIDHLTGNQGTDFFNAVLDNAAGIAAGGPAATLNTGDSLVGVSASNTLYLDDVGIGGYFALPSGITLTNFTVFQLTTNEPVYDPGAPNGAVDLSKIGINNISIFDAPGTSAVKVAPGTMLSVNVHRGSVTTYGGANVNVYGDGALQNQASPENVINGDASTRSVEVESGYNYLIQDANYGKGKPNSITSVTAQSNYGDLLTIDSDALNTLVAEYETLGNTIAINAAAGARTLAISLDDDIGLTIHDQTATRVSIAAVSLDNSAINPASSSLNLQFASAQSVSFVGTVGIGVSNLAAPDATKLTLSGGASFIFSSVVLHDGASIDASGASGGVTLSIAGSASFIGGAGTDTISISAAPSGAITGGSASNNEIVLSNFANASAGALGQVSHFATLGIAGATSGTFDLSAMSGIGTLDLHGSSGNETFLNVPSGLHVNISNGGSVNLALQTADSHGAKDTQSVYIGSNVAYSNFVSQLTTEDASGQGVGTVNLITNSGLQSNYGLGVLVDPGITALNLSGAATIQIEAAIADTATQLSIASNAGSSADYVAGVNDSNLSMLAFSGGVPLTLGTVTSAATTLSITDVNNAGVTMYGLSDSQLTSATFTNSSMATLQISSGYMPLPALTELDLNGNVSMSVNGGMSHAGIAINGATDNANFSYNSTQSELGAGNTDSITLGGGSHVIWLGAGDAGSTQTIQLGNGHFDVVTSTSGTFNLSAGQTSSGLNSIHVSGSPSAFNVSVGNGQNQIIAGGSQSIDISVGTGMNNIFCQGEGSTGQVKFGAHTGIDQISVGSLGPNVDITHILTITGLNNNGSDAIAFGDYNGAIVTPGSMQQVVAAEVSGDPGQLASWVAAAVGQGGLVPQAAHSVVWFQFGGNTFLVETSTADDAGVIGAHDTLVELTGTGYTFANASASGSYLQLKG